MQTRLLVASYLGISTPGRHVISRSPKYSVPRMYCSGFPRDLCSQRSLSTCRQLLGLQAFDFRCAAAAAFSMAKSFSQRSSLRAAPRSRVARRTSGKRASIFFALWNNSGRNLGMCEISVCRGRSLHNSIFDVLPMEVTLAESQDICKHGNDQPHLMHQTL